MLNHWIMFSPMCNSRSTSNLLAILVLSMGLNVSGQSFGWFEGQDSFDGYEYYPSSDSAVLPKENEHFELLECSDYNGVPTICTPMDNCPQLRFIQKQQFCVSKGEDSFGFQGARGPYVCCPNFGPVPPGGVFNRPTIPPTTTTSKYVNSRANSNRFPTTRPSSNRMTVRPDVELVSRGGIDAGANVGCGLLEKDEGGRLGTRMRNFGRLQVLGAAIGGVSVASAAESPWTVAIGEYTSSGSVDWFCGGSLLTKFSVLTAAHCTKRRRPDVVRVGEVDLRRDTKLGEGKGQEIRVQSVVTHPGYHSPSTYSDVAVLTLQMPVDLNRPGGARTICLPPPTNADSVPSMSAQDTYVGKKAALTGWGHLAFGGDKSPILQEVTVTVFKNEDCSRSYSAPSIAAGIKRSYPFGIISTQLCAGDRNGKKDACQGDSGGPLIIKGKDNKHIVIGVISSGIGCGSKQYPGVYARVSSFTNWILKQIVV